MFAKVKQVAALGAAVAGVGWVIFVGPAVANAQPRPIPQDNPITCPDIAGVRDVPDPDNSQAYYICADGSQKDHKVCPADTYIEIDATLPCRPDREGSGRA